jgi:hypothetical protein
MKWMKNIRLITFLLLVLLSSILILYPKFVKPTGVVIVSVDATSACRDLVSVGSVITEIAGKPIKNSADFTRVTKNLEGTITLIINDNPRSCTVSKGEGLNVTVRDLKRGGLKFGVDVLGGTYYIFESKNLSQETLDLVKLRAEKYGLTNTKIKSYDENSIRIEVGSEEEEYVKYLTEEGFLEGRIVQKIDFMNTTAEFSFNDKEYEVNLKDGIISINQSEYQVGQNLVLDGINIRVENISGNATTLSIKVFDGDDLALVKDPRVGYSRISRQDNMYLFIVPVELTEVASENYEKATKNLEITVNPLTGESLSKYPLDVFIDGELIASMPVIGDDIGVKKDRLVIWGSASNAKKATDNMLRLKTTVELKSLPHKLSLTEIGKFSSSSGERLIVLFLCTILVGSVVTSVLFFVKFRKRGVACLPLIPMVLGSIVLVLGIYVQWFALLVFFISVPFVFIKGEVHSWKSWLAIFLLFVLIVGGVITKAVTKWILDSSSIVGLIIVAILGFCGGIFVGNRALAKKESYTEREYKHVIEKLWVFSAIVSSVLIVLFMVGEKFIMFTFTVAVGSWITTSLMIPVYADLIKKHI